MKVKLNFHDRSVFQQLLPVENDLSTLRIVRKVKKDIGISEDEYKYYEIKPLENGGISFNSKKALEEKEFEIGEVAIHLVQSALEKLDKDKKLKEEHLNIYDKVISLVKID